MRFFLNVRHEDTMVEDLEGVELADLDTAREEAMVAAKEILAERVAKGEVVDGEVFEICDEDQRVVVTVPFKDAFHLN